MQPSELWKNFNLGAELDVSGRFIFNGLRAFHEMTSFYHEEDAFEFLYHTAVGIERLLKIAIILIEHNDATDQDAFEKSLITHSHHELAQRLATNRGIKFNGVHGEFLELLSKFYKSDRYGRYSLRSVYAPSRERDNLILFLEKHLSLSIDIATPFGVTSNDRRFKKFIGRVVQKISIALYDLIRSEASRLNLYTYEVAYESKAYKIFMTQEFEFYNEDVLTKELLIYFSTSPKLGKHSKFMSEFTPLQFDPGREDDYIQSFLSDVKKQVVLEELEHLYSEEVPNPKDRLGMLEALGSSMLCFGDEEEDDDEF